MSEPTPESASIPQLEKECEIAVDECTKFLFLTRDSSVQKEQSDKLRKQKDRIKGFKRGAVSAGNQSVANYLFGLQCALNAHASFLDMLRIFKSHDFHRSWDLLIDSHEYISLAHKAAGSQVKLALLSDLVACAERSLFPGFGLYSSWGVVIRGGKCTVCEKQFRECDHIEGKVYWGRLCVRIDFEIVAVNHMALVENPKDRRCIMTEVPVDGVIRDYFTWKAKKKAKIGPDGSVGPTKMVLFNHNLIEID